MANGDELNDQMDFETKIDSMSDRKLLESMARQIYGIRSLCPEHDKRIKSLEDDAKKIAGVTGGITGGITGIIIAVIGYFTNKG